MALLGSFAIDLDVAPGGTSSGGATAPRTTTTTAPRTTTAPANGVPTNGTPKLPPPPPSAVELFRPVSAPLFVCARGFINTGATAEFPQGRCVPDANASTGARPGGTVITETTAALCPGCAKGGDRTTAGGSRPIDTPPRNAPTEPSPAFGATAGAVGGIFEAGALGGRGLLFFLLAGGGLLLLALFTDREERRGRPSTGGRAIGTVGRFKNGRCAIWEGKPRGRGRGGGWRFLSPSDPRCARAVRVG